LTLGAIFLIVLASIVVLGISQNTYAQTHSDDSVIDSPQTTFSGDLVNNPVAQDILRKIEQTKQWIEDIEKRNYEELEKQKELEETRKQALKKLNQDLAAWERLWEYYSPKNSFGRFVEKIPHPQVKEVFWDQFEFKEQKVKAGRDAMKKVFANGGSLQQARQAYLNAAETKRIELIEANAQFNVRRHLAYYEEQMLFDRQGHFINNTTTGEKLRKFYEDFRTNPAYLEANPNDKASWKDFGNTNAETQCRHGYVVIHRFHANDYVCTRTETAEMWIRHGMGEISGQTTENSLSSINDKVSPLTRCDDGFTVIFNMETEMYSCVSDETAQKWVNEGIAQYPDPEEFIMKSIQRKESSLQAEEVNQHIRAMQLRLGEDKSDVEKEYEKKLVELQEYSKREERQAINEYNQRTEMSKDELSRIIISIREEYDSNKEKLLDHKKWDISELENKFVKDMEELMEEYEDDLLIKIIRKSSLDYEAVIRE